MGEGNGPLPLSPAFSPQAQSQAGHTVGLQEMLME